MSATRKIVFIVTKTNIDAAIPLIKNFKEKGDNVVTLPTDFFTKVKLSEAAINYKELEEYLHLDKRREIDKIAANFAKKWYKHINHKITYQEISLGEMVEFEFYYLFTDAIRSIEVASRLIMTEHLDKIFIPAEVNLGDQSEICYEMLPSAALYLAELHKIPVILLESTKDRMSLLNLVKSNVFRIISCNLAKFYNLRQKFKLINCKYDKKVLFISNFVYPWYRAIKREPRDIVLFHLRDYTTKKKEEIEAENLYNRLKNSNKLQEELTYKGIPLIDIMKQRFYQYFNDVFIELIAHIEWANKTVKSIKPDILVVAEDISRSIRAIVKVFKRNGIPVLVLQHGVWGIYDLGGILVMPAEGDKIAVWGGYWKKYLIQRGKREDATAITGNPRYDLIKQKTNKKEEMCKKLKLDPKKKLIVFATQWFGNVSVNETIEKYEKSIRQVLKALRGFSDAQSVVKCHPANYVKYKTIISKVLNEIDANIMITKDYLFELLESCDILITRSSTVGLEAMLFDKPVMIVNLCGQEDSTDYVSSGAAIGVYKEEDLVPAIKAALYNEEVCKKLAEARNKFVYEHAYIQDGKASKRVVDLIIQMIEESRREKDEK